MPFAISRFIAVVSALAMLLVAAVPSVSAQTTGWQPGPGAAGDNTYTGYIDTPPNGATVPAGGSFLVSGWFVDKTAQGWAGADEMQVWLGQMGAGGTQLARGAVGQNRPDVGAALGNPFYAASGFYAGVPGSSVPAGAQTLNVYLHTPAKGWWYRSVNVVGGGGGSGSGTGTSGGSSSAATTGAPVLTVTAPVENENVSTKKGDYTIEGTVSNPASIDRIEAYINGERNSDAGQLLGTTTPASDGTWSIVFRPTKFASTHSNLYVYAITKDGKVTEVVRGFNITDR
jgi:hypothetical protein